VSRMLPKVLENAVGVFCFARIVLVGSGDTGSGCEKRTVYS